VLKLAAHISFLDNNNGSKGFRDSFINLPRGFASLSKYSLVVFFFWHDKVLLLSNYRISKFRVCLYFSKTKGIIFVRNRIFVHLTFRGPCIVIYSYNKRQRDAMFLKFTSIKNSTCFGEIYCPSSGVSTLYTEQ